MLTFDNIDFAASYVTLKGVRHVLVQQEDGTWPPFAIVQATRTAPRDPLVIERQRPVADHVALFLPTVPVYEEDGVVKRKVWCSRCDEWQKPGAFGPDKRKRNGLRSWCRSCENEYRVARYRQGRAA